MQILAFHGLPGAGKDTAARLAGQFITASGASWRSQGFGDEMKVICARALGIGYTERTAQIAEIDRIKLGGVVYYTRPQSERTDATSPGQTGRDFIIGLAEGIRALDPDFWIRQTLVDRGLGHDILIVPDLRFVPEADAVHAMGGKIIEIRRPGTTRVNEDEVRCDAVVHNNGSISRLRQDVTGLSVLRRMIASA